MILSEKRVMLQKIQQVIAVEKVQVNVSKIMTKAILKAMKITTTVMTSAIVHISKDMLTAMRNSTMMPIP